MIADDDDSVRAVIARILRDGGYTVLEARSSDEALALGDDLKLLVADLVMPSTGGVELADTMRARIPGLRVLFTSGYTDGEIERRGLLRAGAAFIQKPLTPSALARAVQKTLTAASPPPGASGGAA